MSDKEKWSPLRNTETEAQWKARHNREKEPAPPADTGPTWDPFRDLPRGRDRLARAGEVLEESIRRGEEDIRLGPEELHKRFNAELLDRARTAQSRGRLPVHLLDAPPDDDDDGGNAA